MELFRSAAVGLQGLIRRPEGTSQPKRGLEKVRAGNISRKPNTGTSQSVIRNMETTGNTKQRAINSNWSQLIIKQFGLCMHSFQKYHVYKPTGIAPVS